MKTVYLLIILLLSESILIYGQTPIWKPILTKTSFAQFWYHQAFVIDSNKCYVIGTRSLKDIPGLIRTTDGGKTWVDLVRADVFKTKVSALSLSLYDNQYACMPDEGHIFIAGSGYLKKGNKIAISTDTAKTWRFVQIEPETNNGIAVTRLYMQDSLRGIYMLYPNYYYLTNDGWRTWTRDSFEIPKLYKTGNGIQSVKFFSTDEFIAWLAPEWNPKTDTLDTNSNKRYALVKTKDRGKHWEIYPTTQEDITNMCFVNKQEGWVLFNKSIDTIGKQKRMIVLHTNDSAKTWELFADTLLYDPKTQTLPLFNARIEFINSQNGMIVGHLRIVTTTDAGKSWIANINNIDTLDVGALSLVSYLSPTRAIAGSTWGLLLRWDAYDTATTTSVKETDIIEGNGLRLYQSESTITIYDEIGRSVLQTHAEQGTIQMEVEVHNLQNGVYSLLVSNKTGVKTLPFVVSR